MAKAVRKVRILEKAEVSGLQSMCVTAWDLSAQQGDGYAQVWLRVRGGEATGR